jgi:hypothetical protein
MQLPRVTLLAVIILLLLVSAPFSSMATTTGQAACETVVGNLNRHLTSPVGVAALVEILRTLNASDNRQLPPAYVTKGQAKKAGWRPGRDLWSVAELRGKSIGGDRFANREGRLPAGNRKWREADLDYSGGHRGAKRLIFAKDGLRMVTVDHYRTFTEVPPCR